ncbi:N-acetylmuramoyl-L-alanine amidase [Compostibacter hankyongensis]
MQPFNLFFSLFIFLGSASLAQTPFIRLLQPSRPVVQTSSPRNYVSGSTCSGCRLSVNGRAVKVYPTGAFAAQLDLQPGDTLMIFKAVSPNGAAHTQKLSYHYAPPAPSQAVRDFRIASVEAFPAEHSWLMPGDVIRFRVKAQPGNQVTVADRITLYEQPAADAGIAGIYQGSYTVKPDDPLLKKTLRVVMKNRDGRTLTYTLSPQYRILDRDEPIVGKTTGALPYLKFGLGDDRLGGAKISYLDTAVLLSVTGKFGGDYRVQLAPGHTAYIPAGNVLLLPKGAFTPRSLTGAWRVRGEGKYDYVSIGLSAKLPYTTRQQTDPSRIVVDIYGATANTNWITQLQSATEIKNVDYEQAGDDHLRAIITLRHRQSWGYLAYYEGNNLVIKIRRPPSSLALSQLTIAVDAGHGGSNRGAQGPTGVFEKNLTLLIAKELKTQLRQAGARVIMTREKDASLDMIQRTLMLRSAAPDLLVSIHLNSAGDPIHVAGVSTYYRYVAFRPLSAAILKHMLSLGLKEYGNIGRFNFSLNGPTEYPNALVETLFISNPADEMKALDPAFRKRIAGAILAGIKDFLKQAKEE